MNERLKLLYEKAINLPLSPGVYIMKNKDGTIIYIGKAKKLRNRVSQYFGINREHEEKVKKMVSHVYDFEYILTDSEFEALILECNMIKRYQPKYNILLKDDKGYVYIKITDEDWPRISETNSNKEKAQYIGPYMSKHMTKNLLDEMRNIFKIPDCNRSFTNKSKPCLNYYINKCSAPCARKISKNEYRKQIEDCIGAIKNGNKWIIKKLKQDMNTAADNLNFEKAALIRNKIRSIEKLNDKQKVVSNKIKEQDVIAMVNFGNKDCYNVLRFTSGALYDREYFIIDHDSLELSEFIIQYYNKRKVPEVIAVDRNLDSVKDLGNYLSKELNRSIKINFPKKGEQMQLINMCKKNADEVLSEYLRKNEEENNVLIELKNVLNLDEIPNYIEAYDISNISGSDNVAGMIVYENGKPNKALYRKFEIREVAGQDDYLSMREVLGRRFDEYLLGNVDFGHRPDLILVDGGKGQVSAAESVLKKRDISIPVCGMVKDDRHKTKGLFFNKELKMINDRLLLFISSIQDEVHRFSINYQRNKHKKSTLNSLLLKIPSIGPKRAKILIKHFKTIDRLRLASVKEISLIPGMTQSSAQCVVDYFKLSSKKSTFL